MFSPPIAKPQIKVSADPTHNPFHQHATLAPKSFSYDRPEADGKRTPVAPTEWNFNNIPIFHRTNQCQTQAPLSVLQRKIAIGRADDPLEHEADHIADQVMRRLDPEVSMAVAPPQLRRKCAGCEEEALRSAAPEVESTINLARGRGQSLDHGVRRQMESAFGADFSGVRVHTGREAHELNRTVQAIAFTTGEDIFFRDGKYNPGSVEGKKLLAHELTHVMQQGDGRAAAPRQSGIAQAIRRQDQTDTTGGDGGPPMGAPPVFQDDFDPVPESDTAQPSGDQAQASTVQTSLQRANDSSLIIQRQSGGGSAGSPQQVVAQSLSWSDFPTVPNKINGMSHQTGVKRSWRNDGTGFNIAFNPSDSWSVQADQTDELLRHEQYHLNLAALVANKANAAAAAGTMTGKALINAFSHASDVHDRSYDQDTKNGVDTHLQIMWEHDINNGVPEFPITGP